MELHITRCVQADELTLVVSVSGLSADQQSALDTLPNWDPVLYKTPGGVTVTFRDVSSGTPVQIPFGDGYVLAAEAIVKFNDQLSSMGDKFAAMAPYVTSSGVQFDF